MLLRSATLLLLSPLLLSASVSGQSVAPVPAVSGALESRTELERRLAAAVSENRTADATVIRNRLQAGDFQEGDRIYVRVQGPGGWADTLIVRAGRRLELGQLGEVALAGVLRSELRDTLLAHIGRYVRDASVHVSPLVRVGLLGSVGRPGYFYFPADLPFSDALMAAGGPQGNADLSRVTVKRGEAVVIDRRSASSALREGTSLDVLNVRAGDVINVGARRQINWGMIIPSVSAVIGIAVALSR
jgi:hypothetical protein